MVLIMCEERIPYYYTLRRHTTSLYSRSPNNFPYCNVHNCVLPSFVLNFLKSLMTYATTVDFTSLFLYFILYD